MLTQFFVSENDNEIIIALTAKSHVSHIDEIWIKVLDMGSTSIQNCYTQAKIVRRIKNN